MVRSGWGLLLTQDPIGLAGGTNLYAYAGNNPVSFSDPYGLCKETEPDCSTLSRILENAVNWLSSAPGKAVTALAEAVSVIGDAVGLVPGVTNAAQAATGIDGAGNQMSGGQRAGALAMAVGEVVTAGETSATARGRAAHRAYSAARESEGYVVNKAIPGTRLRPDALHVENRVIRELKPNNARAISRGVQQAQRYVEAAQAHYGGSWTFIIDTY